MYPQATTFDHAAWRLAWNTARTAKRAARFFLRAARTVVRKPQAVGQRLRALPMQVRSYLRQVPPRIETQLHATDLVAATHWLLRFLRVKSWKVEKKRSLWAGTPIINMAFNARAERLLGIQADSLVFVTYFITKQFDYNLERWMKLPVIRTLLPYAAFVWACMRYQRFHFYCDSGILPIPRRHRFNPRELAILKELGKEVIFWTYGGDVRTRATTYALGEYNCCIECPDVGTACVCDDPTGKQYMADLQRYGPIFAMGDMIEYTPGSRNDLFFWPLDLGAENGQRYAVRYPEPDSTKPLRVVHAPNHRHYKGTRFLLEAVAKLQAEGLPIELKLVERVPNREALEIYRTADVIFDQCIIGFHGYFALEAMAMGKPVMCYIRDPARYLLHHEECPFINARADRVEATLRELVADRPRLQHLGMQGRRYIEKHFTLRAFAGRLKTAYQDLGISVA